MCQTFLMCTAIIVECRVMIVYQYTLEIYYRSAFNTLMTFILSCKVHCGSIIGTQSYVDILSVDTARGKVNPHDR
jgi:hypothetical protein